MLQKKPFLRWLVLAFGLAITVVLAGGAWFYNAQEQSMQRRIETELQTVGQFKVDQIVAWRAERIGDANTIMDNVFLVDAIARWMVSPQPDNTELILSQFQSLQDHYHYADVELVDARGQIRLSLGGESGTVHAEVAPTLAQVLRDRQPALTDLHFSPSDQSPHLDVMAPLFAQNGAASEPVGAVILEVAARQFLYPLIESRPTPSRTAETLLVQRDGDAALFLNDLRYQKGAALLRRIPLTKVDVPAVMVVLGQRGNVQGKDYRGVAVLAGISAVPDSPWFMVSKMDRDEAFADWRNQSAFILALILLFVVATIAGAGMVWQGNEKAHYRSLARTEESLQIALTESVTREHEMSALLQATRAVTVTSTFEGAARQIFDICRQVTGATSGYVALLSKDGQENEVLFLEAGGLPCNVDPSLPMPIRGLRAEAFKSGKVVYDNGFANSEWQRFMPDGHVALHNVVFAPMSLQGKVVGLLGIANKPQDFTEKDAALAGMLAEVVSVALQRAYTDDALRESEEKYRNLFENAQVGMYRSKLDGTTLLDVNSKFCEIMGFSHQELLGAPGRIRWAKQEDRDRMLKLLKEQGGFLVDYEAQVLAKNGDIKDVLASIKLPPDKGCLEGSMVDITERKRAEEEYQTIISTAMDGFWITDMQGRFLDVNDAYCHLIGYSREELLKTGIQDVEAAEKLEETAGHIQKIIETGHDRFETQHRGKNGGIVALEVSVNFQSSHGGRLYVFLRDITERKRAENALALNAVRIEALLELHKLMDAPQPQLLDFVLEASLKTTQSQLAFIGLLDDAEAVMTIHAFSKDTLAQCAFDDKPRQFPIAEAGIWGECVRRRAPFMLNQYGDPHPNKKGVPAGHVPITRFLAVPVFDGDHIVAVAAVANKTEVYTESDSQALTILLDRTWGIIWRKQVEKALHESEEHFRRLFNGGNDAIFVFGLPENGTPTPFIEVNDVACARLGYTRAELLNMLPPAINAPESAADFPAALKQLVENKSVIVTATHLAKDGRLIPVEISAQIFELGGKPLIFAIARDITERRQAEAQVFNLNAELEQRASQLEAARDEAERANRAKSEFLSRMSHELRTPLNSILGFAQLLEMDELEPRHAKGVGYILTAGHHLLDMINEVLDLARIESGRLALSLEPVQLRSLILETLDLVRSMADARRLTLELADAPADDLFVRADRQRLKQVLLNLINNAIKYNREGGSVIIDCGLQIAETDPQSSFRNPHSAIRIRVSDTGPGIAPKNLERLFNPFERIGAEQTETEGTGLGLAVAKKLVEAMGGRIGVASVLGQGSTFWLELPQAENPPESAQRMSALAGIVADPIKTGTVLYVEDNLSNLQLVEQILTRRPAINLITAMQGRLAIDIALAREHRLDLILLDLNLPDMRGEDVLRRLRAEPETQATPVVVLSADATPDQIERLKAAGVQDYLTKPLDVRQLLQVVDKIMGDR